MSSWDQTPSNQESHSSPRDKKIIVAVFLPLHAERDSEGTLSFTFDEDSLMFQLKEGFSHETQAVYVGCLKIDVNVNEQDIVSDKLLEEFNCVPVFLSPGLHERFYYGFCVQYLCPIFQVPLFLEYNNYYDKLLWDSYLYANEQYADRVMSVCDPEDEHGHIWIHDYHLMVVPSFLRRNYRHSRIGFFLHSPFPSSEIFRTLPVREEILKGFLNTDLVGFQTYDSARNFLSCCGRILGLEYESRQDHIALEYFGRQIFIKILPVGVHRSRLESALNLDSSCDKVKEIQKQFEGKELILGIDDVEVFKGIPLKLLALEQLLKQHPKRQGSSVLVQILNPAMSMGADIQEAKTEAQMIMSRINQTYGSPGYEPVILIEQDVPLLEKIAYYTLAECCIVNSVRDGLNLCPHQYTVCRQGTPKTGEVLGIAAGTPRRSMLVVSEFVGCSPSFSGAIRVNPWDIAAVAEAINEAISMDDLEKQVRHEKHYSYVSSHDLTHWVRGFVLHLEQACRGHKLRHRRLPNDQILAAYRRTNTRMIFLDYEAALVPHNSVPTSPSPHVILTIKNLCNNPRNNVFILSGREISCLTEWFVDCNFLGLVAEHGYFMRWPNGLWDYNEATHDLDWYNIVQQTMELYTETTDGSYVEARTSSLVWHHHGADPDFGISQAKVLVDHLVHILANRPAVVTRGRGIVEVKAQGLSKGLVANDILVKMLANNFLIDFVLCIGDDRSDEDMFERISRTCNDSSQRKTPEIFTCNVGQRISNATYYLEDADAVVKLLDLLKFRM